MAFKPFVKKGAVKGKVLSPAEKKKAELEAKKKKKK